MNGTSIFNVDEKKRVYVLLRDYFSYNMIRVQLCITIKVENLETIAFLSSFKSPINDQCSTILFYMHITLNTINIYIYILKHASVYNHYYIIVLTYNVIMNI